MNTRLLIGIASGLVSGLVLASAGRGSLPGLIVLFFLSPLPIAITGLGWGWLSALAAAVSAALVLAIGIAPKTGLVHLISIGLPIAGLTYLLLLHRPRPAQAPPRPGTVTAVEWYPVGRVVGAAAFLAGALSALALVGIGTSTAEVEAEVGTFVERFFAAQAKLPDSEAATLGAEERERMTKRLTAYLAPVVASMWLFLAMLNLWLGGHVARMSGLLARPWPDLSTIVAPRELSVGFALAVALSFLPDFPGLLASGFATAFMMAYLIVGLAIIHNLTRASPYRPLILFAVYGGAIFLQPLSGLTLAVLALAEPFLPFRRKGPFDADRPPPPPT